MIPMVDRKAREAAALEDEPGFRGGDIRAIGRPPVHAEAYSKATVILLNRQIVYLDRLSADIRASSGTVVKRAEIIRALIDALSALDLDLRDVRSEADLKKRFLGAASGDARESERD